MTRRSGDGVAAPPVHEGWAARAVSAGLPEFPWDRLHPYQQAAAAHPDGVVDLSIGTPVDPTPRVVQEALLAAADAPGYPTTSGTEALRAAAVGWLERRLGVRVDPDAVLPAIGSKELVASLPTLLGLGRRDLVAYPELAYPTYDIGARLAGATRLAADVPFDIGGGPARRLLWINSPSNPTGRVLPAVRLREIVRWARERGFTVASDECYIELGWDADPISVLHPDACEGSHAGLLALHSLSKRSNLAGYRAGFVAGDPVLVKELLEVRKHVGMMVPLPVQAAMTAALQDDRHVEDQRRRYAARRSALLPALRGAGFSIEHSEAGLYLWATRDEPCWETLDWFAKLGILVAPGEFYGGSGSRHVRVALTTTDERVGAAVARLAPGT